MDIQREEFELTFQKTSFCKNMVKSLENSDCPFTSVFEMRNGKYRSSYVQLSFEIWQAAKAQAVPDGFVLVPRQPNEKTLIKMSWSVALGEDQHGNSVYLSIDEAKQAYEAVIEAQEQGQ